MGRYVPIIQEMCNSSVTNTSLVKRVYQSIDMKLVFGISRWILFWLEIIEPFGRFKKEEI